MKSLIKKKIAEINIYVTNNHSTENYISIPYALELLSTLDCTCQKEKIVIILYEEGKKVMKGVKKKGFTGTI